MKEKQDKENKRVCLRQSALYNVLECACTCACVLVCVSEMNSMWPGCINSLPDWLQLSRNVTGEPERDLIAIRELPPSSRGRGTANFHLCVNTNRSVPQLRLRAIHLSGTGVQEKGVDQPGGQLNSIIIHTINRVQCS